MELDSRKLAILAAVVDSYIMTGDPVSSKAICDMSDLSLSSATIRNEMADLTSLGLLEQPHTSAGRIPSQLGYRVYINKIMHKRHLSEADQKAIDEALTSSLKDPDDLLKGAIQVLADLSQYAVVSVLPYKNSMRIKSIQIVLIGKKSGMLIMITSCGIIRNRIFCCSYELTPEIIEVCSSVLNDLLDDVLIQNVTKDFIESLAVSLGELLFMLSPMLGVIYEISSEANGLNVKSEGKQNLLFLPEFRSDDISARRVMNFLEKNDEIAHLLLQSQNKGPQVLIGQESNIDELANSSVIISGYELPNDNFGAISIIGPTRMDYAKMISNIEYLASVIERILKDILDL